MAEEVVDITLAAEEEEINIILAVAVGMVVKCSNNSKMINTIKEAVEEEAVAAAGTIRATIRAMVTSTKADTAEEAEGEGIGAVEVRQSIRRQSIAVNFSSFLLSLGFSTYPIA